MNTTFINLLIDVAFKRIFGSEANEDITIDLLNAFIPGKHIISITFLDKEHPRRAKKNKSSIFDILCVTDKGEYIIIEVQQATQDFLIGRGLFYTAIRIYEQGERGKKFSYDLKEICFICIANFIFDKIHKDQVVHQVKLTDQETGEVFTNLLNSIYIELPKFNKRESELRTRLDIWLFVLKNISKLRQIPLALKQDKIFVKLFKAAKLANLNEKEMTTYQRSLMVYRDNQNIRDSAIRQGLAEGLEEGLAKGLAKGEAKGEAKGLAKGILKEKLNIIRILLTQDDPLDKIAQATRLSVQELQQLIVRHKLDKL